MEWRKKATALLLEIPIVQLNATNLGHSIDLIPPDPSTVAG